MRRIIFLIFLACLAIQTATAQPKKSRIPKTTASSSGNKSDNLTTRAQISFPTAQTMSEDVVWRRDVYREISLTDDANAGLYYPVEPVGSQMNLFTYMFKLMLTGRIKAYEYRLDGSELFTEAARVKPLKFLDDYHIYYEKTDRGVHLDDSDIPSKEVKAYYIKESTYYDQNTATFHTKVLALCPIMEREDDFGDGTTKYPLFWVVYDDLAPYLAKQTIMTSNLNNAATMSVEDFFTMNHYRGKIYKTNNMLGETLAQACGGDTTKMSAEQRKIEKEIEQFETGIWGDKQLNDSLDSVASNSKMTVKARKKRERQNRRLNRGSSTTTTAKGNSPARVTVRRQRH